MKFPIKEVKTRLFWLSIGLVLSLVIAKVISGFEHVLEKNLILAAFIPLIVYMSDAVGTQMEAMIIRELSRPKKFNFRKFLTRQVSIVLPVAIILSILCAGILLVWHDDSTLAVVVSLSVFFGICSSVLTGAFMPYMFWRMHKDPAEASGPIATVLQDLMSIVVFFYIAQLFY